MLERGRSAAVTEGLPARFIFSRRTSINRFRAHNMTLRFRKSGLHHVLTWNTCSPKTRAGLKPNVP